MLVSSEPLSEDAGLLTLRVVAGGSMVYQHGWPKLVHFADKMDHFADPIGMGPVISLALITLAESVCAALVMLGLWTRITTVPVIIGMAVVAFMVKGGQGFAERELALVYLGAFLTIFLAGSGRFSLDRLTFR